MVNERQWKYFMAIWCIAFVLINIETGDSVFCVELTWTQMKYDQRQRTCTGNATCAHFNLILGSMCRSNEHHKFLVISFQSYVDIPRIITVWDCRCTVSCSVPLTRKTDVTRTKQMNVVCYTLVRHFETESRSETVHINGYELVTKWGGEK